MPLPPQLKLRDPFTHRPEEISLERWLLSDDPAEQRLADEAVAEMGPDATRRAFEQILEREVKLRKKGGKIVGFALMGSIFCTFISMDALLGTHIAGACGGVVGGFSHLLINGLSPSKLQYAIWERMTRTGDIHTLPVLVAALASLDERARQIVRPALLRLLPRMEPEHSPLIPAAHWLILATALDVRTKLKHKEKRAEDIELARAVLHALGKARPAIARERLLKLVNAKKLEDDMLPLQQIARNYLALWEAPPSVLHPSPDLEAESRSTAARDWTAAATTAANLVPEQTHQHTGRG